VSQEARDAEHEWLLKMVALEEEYGEFLPAGAGGIGPRGRSAGKNKPTRAMRARGNVRFIARAVPASDKNKRAA
jgi:hypothetical protein